MELTILFFLNAMKRGSANILPKCWSQIFVCFTHVGRLTKVCATAFNRIFSLVVNALVTS